MNTPKQKLLDHIKNDVSIFDFIQQWGLDGLYYRDAFVTENEWINPRLWINLGYDSTEIYSESNSNKEHLITIGIKNTLNQDTAILLHKNGSKISMQCKNRTIKNNEGKTVAYLSCYIKSKIEVNSKKYLKKIKKQEEFLEKSNEAALIGYWDFNVKKMKLDWSSMTKIIHEAPADFVPNVATGINFYLEGDSRNAIEKSFNECASSGTPFNLELQIVTLKGNIKWVRSIGQGVFHQGVCKRIYGTFQDISKVKEATIALEQEKEKLQSIIQSTNSGTWQWNVQTDETQHNEIWANIIGYSLSEIAPVTTEKWQNLLHPDDLQQSNLLMKDCFEENKEYYEAEYRIKHKKGHWIWVLDKGKIISWTKDRKPLLMFGIHTDITEQKKSILRNMLFIEHTPTAIAMVDVNMNYLAASKKWQEDYNLTGKKILGVSHYDLFPEISEQWKEIHKNCLKGQTDRKDEDKFVRSDGSVQWISWSIKPWYNDNGTVGGLLMFTSDITARKKTEEQLKISEQTFRENFENAAIGMAFRDKTGKWLKVNQRLCEMLNYSSEELLTKTFQDITHPDDLNLDLELLKELIQRKRSYYHMEKRYFSKDNEIVYTILGVSVARGEDDEILYFISQIIDITAQKKAEQQLEDNNSKMKALFEASTQVALIETDVFGLIRTFNKGAENLLGYNKDEILHIETPAIIHLTSEIEERSREIQEKNNEIVQGFDVFTYGANKNEFDTREWTYVKKDGTQFPVQLTVTSVKKDNVVNGYLGIATDISYIKKTEKEIQSLLEVTKDQNERLKNFAHIVSHNLRSHSGNIAMMLDLYVQEYPELESNQFIEMLTMASSNLKNTITHLNEVVLMNTATSENLQDVNLNDFMEQTIKNVAGLAMHAQIEIINTIDNSLNIQVIPAYLESILLNFVTNGIKYKSNKGDSFIKVYTTTEDEYIVLHVEDNGIGIDLKKNRDKLFGMYKTFHNNKDARGIGLFISKNQVEAMNGKIEVESEVNFGTTFKIYFNYEKN
ncbi:PAS domain S-box protein [Flavobacterium sp.]|uniref:PAS domain S-box protein n=1 Tax=Flavobacterium sp. TaxID=239 RepID=UPI00262258F3|nr:PAS domain S-box protein [Flavobacterium sp.]MDG2432161.1 PAS domain S-box protein [Flavobacterium sp.]